MVPDRNRRTLAVAGCLMLLTGEIAVAAADISVEAIQSFLRGNFDPRRGCIVIGLVDRNRSQVIPWGQLGNGTDQQVSGDSVFSIGSVSKTFTALLFLDMVDRGEMKLDDPAAKYLPASVKLPTHGGKEITLLDLATHAAGLPVNPDNMAGGNEKERYENYSIDKMYEFLSRYQLSRDPGTEFEYSNVGMALLGHIIVRRAGADFDSLVRRRVGEPLHMVSTGAVLTPKLQSRLAVGHDKFGKPSLPWRLKVYAPAGSLFSTANDLLQYVSAHAGLRSSRLSSLMNESHLIRYRDFRGLPEVPDFGVFGQTAMDWVDRAAQQSQGMDLLAHAGGAGSYHVFVGFDVKQQRGVVVLTTINEGLSAEAVGWTLLQRLPLTVESVKVFARETVGIGVVLDLDPLVEGLRIRRTFAASPAATAGLSSGMVIRRINGTSIAGKSLEECMRLLLGPVGTKVRLEVLDSDGKTPSIEVTRQKFMAQP